MLKNLLKVAFRNIRKEKGYSAINILGLTIGITCSILLLLYILDELSYDRYHEKADNIYRIVSHIKEPDNEFTWAVAQYVLADELLEKYPEVQNAVRLNNLGRRLFQKDEKSFYEEDFYIADSTLFDIFTYEFINGDPATALDEPNNTVLTKSMAIKYFDKTDIIGETLTDLNTNQTYKVTGVIEEVPYNSHLRFDGLVSASTFTQYQQQSSWGGFGVFTYIEFQDNYNPAEFQSNLENIVTERVNPIFESMGISVKYELQRITDIHLHSKIQDEAEAGGDISYVYIFSAIAAFMLIIACINYMNLATARSAKRAKEVGIRKVMGSMRGQLIRQFISESVVLAVIALIISLGLIYILIPSFNDLANKHIVFSDLFDIRVILALIGTVVFVGIIGGSYPAFYLSKFNPATVLKGKVTNKGGNAFIRKTLVVLQFSISIFMLISTLVVFNQLDFLMNKDLGFNKDQVLRIQVPDQQMRSSLNVFKNKLVSEPDIKVMATSSTTPGSNIGKVIFNVEDNKGEMLEKGIDFYWADYDFIDALGMKIVEGRNFSRDILSDTIEAALVNEAMVERMNWQDPIGKKFEIPTQNGPQVKRVIGVVKDYHQNSLYDVIEPLMIMFKEGNYYTYVKLTGQDLKAGVASVESHWKEVYPNKPFEFQFLDQDFAAQYDADETRGTIFTIFSILTIIIACLGLLGLTSFTTAQRTKEIGVRKVIGATVQSIIILISKEFILLVALATLIAFPVAYYFMNSWLEAFAYRIELKNEVLTFILSAVIALTITMLTVGYHSAKAAMANPVNSLKDE
ncbi:MAG: ABC transporter permease [Candidatus Cyclobacteriaceae bacterium M2_1C_046]